MRNHLFSCPFLSGTAVQGGAVAWAFGGVLQSAFKAESGVSMSAIDCAEAALERILRDEDRLQAYAWLDRDTVIAEARLLDGEGVTGPLSGHTVAIKDIFDTADMPTACGSPIYTGRRPERDAAAVAAIRAAGGLVVGKSVTTEFAHLTPGPTRNPHNVAHTPGGSSSGSAATVAAGGATLATGTQTAGSIIRPAAFCGIVGYKPSFAMISRNGLSLFSETLDTIGGFARNVSDAALFVGVMAGRDDLATPIVPQVPRFAVWATPDAGDAEPYSVTELDRVAERAASAGAVVEALPAADVWHALLDAQKVIMAWEGARALAFERRVHNDLLSDPLRAYLDEAARISHEAYLAALQTRRTAGADLTDAMEPFDAILTLSARGEAPLAEAGTGDPQFNRVWTLLGGPALHLPTATGPLGLPIGVQLVANQGRDARLLGTALWLENALR
jgi:Asp-tRNA(Asn)/Glu-tRNA(Gln) amidotransferase A subunit family amidase